MASDVPSLRLLQGDEADLFRRHEVALRAAVRHRVNASEAIIEDACSFAWLQLMRSQPRRETVFPWLRRVAIREAWRLAALAMRELPPVDPDTDLRHTYDSPPATAEAHLLISAVRTLPPRQQRVLLLLVSGHSYKEIAADQNLSWTSVNKALARARSHLRLVRDLD